MPTFQVPLTDTDILALLECADVATLDPPWDGRVPTERRALVEAAAAKLGRYIRLEQVSCRS